MVMLNKKNMEKLNPATEEKQDAIIAALGGIPTSEHATIEDLIAALASDFTELQGKFTDATQKTKIISDAGVVADLTTQLAAILTKFTDHLQLTQVVKSDGTPVDFAAQFTSLIGKFTDATQKTQVVDASGANLYPAGKSAVIEVRLNRPADVIQYTVGDAINSSVGAPVTLDLANFALANGKGAWITGIVVATNLLNLANSTIRLWLYRTTPSSLVGDNVAFTTMDANTAAGRTSIDVTFGSLLTGSDVIIGQVSPWLLMQCDVAHADIQQVIQTLATFTPVSGGFIDFTYTLLQL